MMASWIEPMRAGRIPAFAGRRDGMPVRKSEFSHGRPTTRTLSSRAISARIRIAIASEAGAVEQRPVAASGASAPARTRGGGAWARRVAGGHQ